MVGVTQRGNYYNDSKVFVENQFGIRLFYILQQDSGTYNGLPLSFCHNYDPNGNKLVHTSLSWKAEDGLYNKLWKQWLNMLINAWIVKASFQFDVIDIHQLNEVDVMLVNNNQFLMKKIGQELPIRYNLEVEMVKL